MPVQTISLPPSISSIGHGFAPTSSTRPRASIPRIKFSASSLLRHGYRTPSNHAADSKHHNSLNLACTLPDPLLHQIFMHCAADTVGDGEEWSWVTISFVCSSWRKVALESSDLWRYVDFSHPQWHKLTWTRAKMSSLHVVAVVTDYNIRQLRRTLQLAHRIQDIHLISPFEKIHPLLEILTCPNPALESLIVDVSSPPSPPPGAINTHPQSLYPSSYGGPPLTKLKYMELHHAPFYLLTSRCTYLTHLRLHDLPLTERPTLHHFLNMLEQLSSLRSVVLDQAFPIDIEFDNIQERRINLRRLEDISLVGDMLEVRNLLDHMMIPPSAHLIAKISIPLNLALSPSTPLLNFTKTLSTFACANTTLNPLEILVLTGYESCQRYTAALSPNPEFRQSLRIRAFNSGSECPVIDLTVHPAQRDIDDDGLITALTAIWKTLLLTSVHTLALQNLDIVTQISWNTFLRSLPNLRVLDIAGRAPSGLVWSLLLNARTSGKRLKGRRKSQRQLLLPSLEDIYLHDVDCSSGGFMVSPKAPVNSHRDLDDSRFLDVLVASLYHRRRFAFCLRSLCIARCAFVLRKAVEDARGAVSYLVYDSYNVMKKEPPVDEDFPARYPDEWLAEAAQLRHYHRLRALTGLDGVVKGAAI